ncbi:MAG: DUF6602 domain-containing protein [Gammaproteobacteria bacterium]
MNRIDEWTQFISKCLKSETELLGIQAKHDIYEDAARATFIRVVLEQFLPGSFAVGSGRVIDASGNSSNELDIVIYRRDFPQLNLPGSANVFLYESVLATIEVKTKLIRKTFFDAMDNCASMGELNPAVNPVALRKLALRNKLVLNENNEYVHEDPLRTARFNLIGRPPSFVYAFSGYQTSLKQLKENIDLWIDHRRKKDLNYEMKSFPSMIATQGCFAWRNAAPFAIKKNFMLGLGTDSTPVRLIILQLMNALNRRLRGTNDKSGMNLNLDAYISHIDPPKFTSSCGKVINPRATTSTIIPTVKERDSAPVEKKTVSAPVDKKTDPVPVEMKVDPDPVEMKVNPVPVEMKADPAPAAKTAIPDPVKKKTVSQPVAEKADPTSVEMELVPIAAEKTTEESSKLETYAVFKPPPAPEKEPDQTAALETKATTGSDPAPGENATGGSAFIEPEPAQTEFIEPEIIEPESESGIDLKTKPDSDEDPFESTIVMPSVDAQKILKPAVESKPEPELDDKPEPEMDSFSKTIRMPTHELEKISSPKKATESEPTKNSKPRAANGQGHVPEPDPDPYSRTIPQ